MNKSSFIRFLKAKCLKMLLPCVADVLTKSVKRGVFGGRLWSLRAHTHSILFLKVLI